MAQTAIAGPRRHARHRRLHPYPLRSGAWNGASATISGHDLLVSVALEGAGTVTLVLLKPAGGLVSRSRTTALPKVKHTMRFRLALPRRTADLDLYRLRVEFQPSGKNRAKRSIILPLSRIINYPMITLDGQRTLIIGAVASLKIVVRSPQLRAFANARVDVAITRKHRPPVTARSRTDSAGLARLSMHIPSRWTPGPASITITAWSAGLRRRIRLPARIARRAQILLHTDKPIYQPGQTVHLRILALTEPARQPKAGTKVTVSLRDPRKNLVFEEHLRTDDFGVAATDAPLATGILTGRYTIQAGLDDARQGERTVRMTKTIKVFAYRPPILAVEAHMDRPFYRPGAHAVLEVRAHHMWGSKVQTGRVSVSSHLEMHLKGGGVTTHEQGSYRGNFDAQGIYRVTIPIPSAKSLYAYADGGYRMIVAMKVTASGGFSAKKTISVPVSKQSILIDALPNMGKLVAGLPQPVTIVAVTPDGRPARATLSVRLDHGRFVARPAAPSLPRIWPWSRRSDAQAHQPRRPGRRMEVRTDRHGVATLWVLAHRRSHHGLRMVIQARDPQGHQGRHAARLAFWKGRGLVVTTNRTLIRAGNRVRITVYGPKNFNGNLYLELGGWGQTTTTLSAVMTAGRASMEAAIPKSAVGAMRLSAQLDDGTKQPPQGNTILFVQPLDRLRVHMAWNQSAYRPGQPASLAISVTDEQGRPRQAALGLAVIDQAIYSMTGTHPQSHIERFLLDDPARESTMSFQSVTAEKLLAGPASTDRQALAGALAGLFLKKGYQGFWHDLHRTIKQEAAAYQVSLHRRLARVLKPWFRRRAKVIGAAMKRFWKAKYRNKSLCDNEWPLFPTVAKLLRKNALNAQDAQDPWGHRMQIQAKDGDRCCPMYPKSGILMIMLQSAGPDGRFETADDLLMGPYRVSMRAIPRNHNCSVGCGCGGGGGFGGPSAFGHSVFIRMGHANLRPPGFANQQRITVRKRMAETLTWQPLLRTDDQGHAKVRISLADNITTWVASILASDRSGRLGFTVARSRALKKLFLDMNLPLRLSRGDRLNLPVVLHNETSHRRPVTVSLRPAGWYHTPNATKRVVLPAHGTKQVLFPIEVRRLGPQKLTAMVTGRSLGDGLTRTTLVEPRGMPVQLATSGTLSSSLLGSITIPPSVSKGTGKLTVTLQSGLPGVIRDSLSGLLRQPSGCFEQNASITYPNILVHHILGRRKDALWKKAHRFVLAGYQRMLSYEVPGGGFSLFGQKPSSIFLTALGLHMMADLKGLVPVDPIVIRRSIRFLSDHQKSNGAFADDPKLTAYVAWAMARHRRRSNTVSRAIRFLRSSRTKLLASPYATALAASALGAARRIKTRLGARLLASLSATARRARDGSRFWETKAAAAARSAGNRAIPAGGEGIFTLSGSAGLSAKTEITGLATRVLAQRSNSFDLARRAIKYLLTHRDQGGAWYSTQATVLALQALRAGQGFLGSRSVGTVAVLFDGRPAGHITLSGHRRGHSLSSLTLDRAMLTPGRHRIRLVPSKRGSVLYRIALSYKTDPKPAAPAANEEPRTTATPQSRRLPRTAVGGSNRFLVDVAARARANPEGPILSAKMTYPRRALRRYESITTYLEVANRTGYSSKAPMVELRLAPGMTPMRSDLDAMVRTKQIQRYEVSPGRIVFYLSRLPHGTSRSLSLRMVPTLTGRFSTNLSSIYDYYYPEGKAYVHPQTLVIR